jgi:hypothetical protein
LFLGFSPTLFFIGDRGPLLAITLAILVTTFEFRRRSFELNEKIEEISSRLDAQTTPIREVQEEIHHLRANTIALLTFASENDALASEPFQRVLPVSCYTSIGDPTVTGAVDEAVVNLMAAIGFNPLYEESPQVGYWFKKVWFQAKDGLSKPEVQDRLAKLERALELKHIDRPQATVDLALSQATLNLGKTLDNVDDGIISARSLVVIKTTTAGGRKRLVVHSLNQEQRELVKSNPKMLTDPSTFLTILETPQKPLGTTVSS